MQERGQGAEHLVAVADSPEIPERRGKKRIFAVAPEEELNIQEQQIRVRARYVDEPIIQAVFSGAQ